ncbi:MAG TPA: ATP-binding cassette domain-containing protein [Acidimicrobiales bacterium]|nr:ATP-binding cassette domain-containing protein [Acidimicrobiales bacterium]
MAELEVRDLTVEFDSGGYVVRPLDNFSFEAEDGEFVAIVGPSGCGKTTMLSCLAGLLTPTSGSIRFRDTEVNSLSGAALGTYRQSTVGVVFQAFNLIPSLSARANVMAPLRLAHVPRQRAAARADELLMMVGLSDRAGNRPGKMSGGQQQRVAIARALVHEPPLILADEPTAHLDHIQVEGILRLMRELATPSRLLLVVTHDDRITHIADRVIELVPKFATSDRDPEDVKLEPGEILFQQGDRGDLVYVVEDGQIEIYLQRADGGEELLNVVGPGGYFGELGPALNLPRSASARALSASRLTGYPLRAFRRRFPSSSSSLAEGLASPVT